MLRLTAGAGDCWAWLYRSRPTANVVNATGMVGMIGFPAASCRLPIWRPVRPGLPSLKMMTPDAPAAWAFWTFTPKRHVPRWISATRPGTKPLKSLALQPLAEVGVGVGGSTMPPDRLHRAAGHRPCTLPGAPVCVEDIVSGHRGGLAERRDALIGIVGERVLLDGDVIPGVPHRLRDVVRRRLVARLDRKSTRL